MMSHLSLKIIRGLAAKILGVRYPLSKKQIFMRGSSATVYLDKERTCGYVVGFDSTIRVNKKDIELEGVTEVLEEYDSMQGNAIRSIVSYDSSETASGFTFKNRRVSI